MKRKDFVVRMKAVGTRAYTVKAVQLPGCISQGRTRKEAIDNIKEAISNYVDYHVKAGKTVHVYNIGKVSGMKVSVSFNDKAKFRDPHYISLTDMKRMEALKNREKDQRAVGLSSELVRSVSHNDLVAALRRDGFEPAGGGGHDRLEKQDIRRPIMIPRHSEINVGTLKEIIEEAGLTRWEFNMLLSGKTIGQIKQLYDHAKQKVANLQHR